MVVSHITDSGQADVRYRLGSSGTADTGGNYAFRRSDEGGSETTSHTTSSALMTACIADDDKFHVTFIANLSCREKLMQHYYVERGDNIGASNAARRGEGVSKWTNTSNALDTVRVYNNGSGSYNIGSESIILGWDPGDTHSDSVFEELASVDLSGGATSNLSTSSFSSKKYLWVQGYFKVTSGSPDLTITFNNDTGSNYTRSRSINNAADVLSTCRSSIDVDGSIDRVFINMFIVNTRNNEKLVYGTSVRNNSAAGASAAPDKREWACKWANTSSQISEIDFDVSSSTLTSDSTVKVWGFD